ncbi:MAG: diguanylate cyclase [Archangium sp.]
MPPRFPVDSPLHVFTEEEVNATFAAGTERRCEIDEVIVREGEPGDSMFFLLDGFAGARLETGAMARTYSPGSYFGELSFISPGHRRSATIVATTRARLQVIDQASIERLLVTHPRVVFTLLRRACSFLVDAERNLISDLRRKNNELRDTLQKLDLTRQRLSEEEAIARTDFMTGLSNRRGFDEAFPLFIERAAALNSGVALLAIDLDEFKQVNDLLGHAAGDEVLRRVSAVLESGVRRSDLPCRFGGDEFFVLLGELDVNAARKRAENLCAALSAMAHPGNDKGLRVTATIGGTMFRPGESADDLMKRADAALYAAKNAGRNRLTWD